MILLQSPNLATNDDIPSTARKMVVLFVAYSSARAAAKTELTANRDLSRVLSLAPIVINSFVILSQAYVSNFATQTYEFACNR